MIHGVITTVDEAAPEQTRWTRGTNRVFLTNRSAKLPDARGLLKLFAGRQAQKVKEADISWESMLTDLEVLKPLENLESINVRGRNIKSIETIRSMPTLRRLSLKPKSCARDLAVLEGHQLDTLAVDVCKEADIGHISACDVGQFLGIRKWRWKDLTGLKVRAPDLTINGGSLVSTHGLASNGFDRVYFAQVQKLGSLVGLTARRIWVATCRNLMPEAFAEVRDLRWLYLSSQPEIRSFDFVARLPKLINLSIDATRISTKDLSALAEAGSLQRVWLPKQVGQEVIEAAAKANPRLSISNGVDYFVKGRRASAAGFEAERVELSKVLCQG